MKYLQCQLMKGNTRQVAWIPEHGAKKGAILELKLGEGDRDPGWEVVEVGASKEAAEVQERARDFTRTRKASDI